MRSEVSAQMRLRESLIPGFEKRSTTVTILIQVRARDRVQRGDRLLIDVTKDQPADVGITDRFGHVVAAEEIAPVAERLMGTVGVTQFHQLVRLDIVHDLDTDLFQGRPTRGEAVLHHPLDEGFAGHRAGVAVTVGLSDVVNVGFHGARRDPIDHGVGEGALLLGPTRQTRVAQMCETEERRARDVYLPWMMSLESIVKPPRPYSLRNWAA